MLKIQTLILLFTLVSLSYSSGFDSKFHEILQISEQILKDSHTPFTTLQSYFQQGFNLRSNSDSPDYTYFDFLPTFVGEVKPGQKLNFKNTCFQDSDFELTKNGNDYVMNLDLKSKSSFFCSDFYLIAYHGSYHLEEYLLSGKKTLTLKTPNSDALKYDIETNGVRIFKFKDNLVSTTANISTLLKLLTPELTTLNNDYFAKLNIKYIKDYVGIEMKPRVITDVDIDENLVNSGDFIGIIRLDGLDPTLAWGMGSKTGHTAIAHRIDGVLHICESQAKGTYWDVNGIQCTVFKTWLDKAKKADFNVVWVPLRKEFVDKYDVNKASQFFKSVEGVDYGVYQNQYPGLLTGWIDTYKDNFPCLPPNFDRCLEPHFIDLLWTIAESFSADAANIWQQAMGQRVGLLGRNYSISDAYHQAGLKGINRFDLYQIPEQDHWTYEMQKNGNETVTAPAMVCCVFVCRMWKAAGIFGESTDNINCGEFTNVDAYKLDIFEKNQARPQACQEADPENPLCQLRGKWTLRLDQGPGAENHYNRVPIVNNMAEKCPMLNPLYHQEDTC